jgi:hypothetical protein
VFPIDNLPFILQRLNFRIGSGSPRNQKGAMAPLTLAIASLAVAPVLSCTSVLFGPGATADGSVWVGQSDDGEGAGDARLVWVPAMDWPAGSKRPVFDYGDFPRIVDSERKVPASVL